MRKEKITPRNGPQGTIQKRKNTTRWIKLKSCMDEDKWDELEHKND